MFTTFYVQFIKPEDCLVKLCALLDFTNQRTSDPLTHFQLLILLTELEMCILIYVLIHMSICMYLFYSNLELKPFQRAFNKTIYVIFIGNEFGILFCEFLYRPRWCRGGIHTSDQRRNFVVSFILLDFTYTF